MAGPNQHRHRKRVMVEYGKEREGEDLDFHSILDYLNSYKNKRGKNHRKTDTDFRVLGQLLKAHPLFTRKLPDVWIYSEKEE